MATKTVNATYKQITWTEEPVKASKTLPGKVVVANQERTFTGDMEGFGVATYVMTSADDNKYPDMVTAYAGQMFFDGTILGKKGTVAINTKGVYDHGDIVAQWLIAPETATGELVGIKGRGGYDIKKVNHDSEVKCRLEVEMPQ